MSCEAYGCLGDKEFVVCEKTGKITSVGVCGAFMPVTAYDPYNMGARLACPAPYVFHPPLPHFCKCNLYTLFTDGSAPDGPYVPPKKRVIWTRLGHVHVDANGKCTPYGGLFGKFNRFELINGQLFLIYSGVFGVERKTRSYTFNFRYVC